MPPPACTTEHVATCKAAAHPACGPCNQGDHADCCRHTYPSGHSDGMFNAFPPCACCQAGHERAASIPAGVALAVRKKPVEVAAMLFDGTSAGADAVMAWANDPAKEWFHKDQPVGSYWGQRKADGSPAVFLRILTLETRQMKEGHGDERMVADPGDFIIRGLKGEFYPCKPDIFLKSYDLVPPKPVIDLGELFG